MKKLWMKFKRWLIVKLGGHLEGPKTYKVEYTTVNPQYVMAVFKVPMEYEKFTSYDPEAWLMNHIFDALGDELRLHKDLYKIFEYIDPIRDEKTYKIVMKIVPVGTFD